MTTTAAPKFVIRIGTGYRRHASHDGITSVCGKTGAKVQDYTHIGEANCDICTGRATKMRRSK